MRIQTRIYGPGLPDSGVNDLAEAYRLGLAHARLQAILAWKIDLTSSPMIHPAIIVENWDTLVRAISEATDRFIAEEGTVLGAVIGRLEAGSAND